MPLPIRRSLTEATMDSDNILRGLNMKKFFASAICLLMLCMLCLPVFAADGEPGAYGKWNNSLVQHAVDANGNWLEISMYETDVIPTLDTLAYMGLEEFSPAAIFDLQIQGDPSLVCWPITVSFEQMFDVILHWDGAAWETVGRGDTAVFFSLSPVALLARNTASPAGSVLSEGSPAIVVGIACFAAGLVGGIIIGKKKAEGTMKKRMVSLLLCVLMLGVWAVPAFAEGGSEAVLTDVSIRYVYGEDIFSGLRTKILEGYQIDIGQLGADFNISGIFQDDGTVFFANTFPAGGYIVELQFEKELPGLSDRLVCHISVDRADIIVTPPEPIKGLCYDGSMQQLVTPGSAVGGIMMYSLDGFHFSTDIPEACNAGMYTVSYRAIGDENHNDGLEGRVDAEIGKAVLPSDLFGSVLSKGSFAIVTGVAGMAIGILGTLLATRKKNSAPAAERGEDDE